ncbi:hypothetical protein CR194_10875 [Salipaludibacillus keqinensis]|uniref:Uncharacterized protein n=1 Tax=Salipaludibacillus keqinensis TaxID=2045207 RepID=A0A323TM03_9BACI|nr:hypothetical protein [Salipaludibacillus keqinensis]PYZ93653.1 hypothetical protein CR194_10875 [Salipaludibacillus keqinensis]
MIELHHIESHFPFQQVEWLEKNKFINTERGIKALHLWTDEEQMKHHMQWRDRFAEHAGVLTDRMIQTVNGDKAIPIEAGWMTLHDVVDSSFPVSDYPEEMGQFLGNYVLVPIEETDPPVNQSKERISAFIDVPFPSSTPRFRVLEKMRKEARQREKKADGLARSVEVDGQMQRVLAIESFSQAKEIDGQLFWENKGTELKPSVDVLCSCLRKWVENYGEDRLDLVFNGLNESFPLKNENGLLLLSRLVYPTEYVEFASWFNKTRNDDEVEKRYVALSNQWDVSKKIVAKFVHWLEEAKEKVHYEQIN